MKKVGRPRTDTEGVMVKLPRETIERLDNVRRDQKDIPTRPEMIRRIMQEWFERSEKSSSD
jgi:metal-responsive CopG/Arc/MetJ family transcriptional regulator